jgi:O-antigen/teichoic acid export membrane protein
MKIENKSRFINLIFKNMKKIGILFGAIFLPVVSLAQTYGPRMMDGFNNFNKASGCNYAYNNFEQIVGPIALLLLIPIIGAVLSVIAFVFWLLMLIDSIKHSHKDMKLIWVLVIIFTNLIGAIVYYFMERRPRMKGKKVKEEKVEEKKEE